MSEHGDPHFSRHASAKKGKSEGRVGGSFSHSLWKANKQTKPQEVKGKSVLWFYEITLANNKGIANEGIEIENTSDFNGASKISSEVSSVNHKT